ncbi:MAG: hypothetical protein R8L07_03600 [Alphaproteobacteria bacterium]|nr:hypothetical protein [Alphaproteobacteria bacterium]
MFLTDRVSAAESRGLRLEVSSDFELLYSLELDGHSLSPMFHPRHFDLRDETGFWIAGRDASGRVVHVQAIRVQSPGLGGLDNLWESEFRRLFPLAPRAGTVAAEGAQMFGQVTYHGELWLHESVRGAGFGPLLASVGLACAAIRFDPDHCYGFVEDPNAWSGYAFREGFFTVKPLSEGWRRAEGFLLETDWIVTMSRDDLRRLVERDRRQVQSYTRRQFVPRNEWEAPDGSN